MFFQFLERYALFKDATANLVVALSWPPIRTIVYYSTAVWRQALLAANFLNTSSHQVILPNWHLSQVPVCGSFRAKGQGLFPVPHVINNSEIKCISLPLELRGVQLPLTEITSPLMWKQGGKKRSPLRTARRHEVGSAKPSQHKRMDVDPAVRNIVSLD